jgi:hypothetical protein
MYNNIDQPGMSRGAFAVGMSKPLYAELDETNATGGDALEGSAAGQRRGSSNVFNRGK